MSDLSHDHQVLFDENPLEKLRQLHHRDFTPRVEEILSTLLYCVDDQANAELLLAKGEPPPGCGSRADLEATCQRAKDRFDLALRALRQERITSFKCRWGEWVAHA